MRIRTWSVAAIVAAASMTVVSSPAATWTPRPATYTVVQERDVRITMSDGVRLTADVLHPGTDGVAAPGTFPVLLTQTPYNKAATGLNFRTDYLVTRGYVQVIVDVRGTGSSEGVWDSFGTREQLDGAELVEWARTQPWSNGSIGLHGTSYGAINQLFTAAQQPAGLKAIFPIVPMSDAYRDITGTGGGINTQFIPTWLGLVTGLSLLPPTYVANDPVGALTTLAQHAGGVATFQLTQILRGMSDHENVTYDSAFYRQRSPIEVIDRVAVPTFIVGGWWDLFQRGEPLLYQRLAANGTDTKLLMGPWYHTSPAISSGLPRDGVPPLDQLELRWMDLHVRGVADPDLDTDLADVTLFRLLNDGYERFTSWPPNDVTYRSYALEGSPVLGIVNGSLRAGTPSALADPVGTLVYSSANGACTRSNTQWAAGGVRAPLCEEDQRTGAIGGLTYDLPVATEMQLAGPIAANLVVEANDRDAFIAARLEDVAPDGTVAQLTAGWQLLSMRALDESRTIRSGGMIAQPYHPFTKPSELATPAGTPLEVSVEIFPTFARIPAGHTLRLSLVSSDVPHLTPSAPRQAKLAGSVLTILSGSTLALPIR